MYRITIIIYERVLNRGQIKKSAVFFWNKPHPRPDKHRDVALPEREGAGEEE